jgi:hypothetical protein
MGEKFVHNCILRYSVFLILDHLIKVAAMQTMEHRYNNDPQIHALVDSMEYSIHNLQFTPSENRECAMLAAIHYEQKKQPIVKMPATVSEPPCCMVCGGSLRDAGAGPCPHCGSNIC